MRCAKTGIRFALRDTPGETFHGDLYYSKTLGCLLIRGIASGTSTETPHVILTPGGDVYGVVECTPEFQEFWEKWNVPNGIPSCLYLLCIIADSRF